MTHKLSRILVICGYYNRGLPRRKLANRSISLFLSFSVKKNIYIYIKCERSRRDATESLCSPKINTNMQPRLKHVEMNKIVTNSEIHSHHCFCESRDFKIGRSSHWSLLMKKVFFKILQN